MSFKKKEKKGKRKKELESYKLNGRVKSIWIGGCLEWVLCLFFREGAST